MSWVQILAEDRIRDAMQRGEFDDLPGKGRPLNLEEYFNTPASDRMVCSLLKNAGVLPPELELLREAEVLERESAACRDPQRRNQLRQKLQARRAEFAMAMERRARETRRSPSLEGP